MRAVGIEDAKADRLQVPKLADGADVKLAGELRHGVRGFRHGAHGLIQRLAFLIAVNGAGGAEDQLAVADIVHRFQ